MHFKCWEQCVAHAGETIRLCHESAVSVALRIYVVYVCVCVTDNMEVFLTLAERQYMVKYELDGMRAHRDLKIPGLADGYMLKTRDSICECAARRKIIGSFSNMER